jgi:hypothetical protein
VPICPKRASRAARSWSGKTVKSRCHCGSGGRQSIVVDKPAVSLELNGDSFSASSTFTFRNISTMVEPFSSGNYSGLSEVVV